MKEYTLKKEFTALIFAMMAGCVLVMQALCPTANASEWKAGVASVVITPDGPAWMAGYGGRTEPSEGVIHDLHVKALALEDADGKRAVILTADLIGLEMEFSNTVARKINERFGLPREALFFNTSHTHCGPETRLARIPFYTLPEGYKEKIIEYNRFLEGKCIEAVSRSILDLKPAKLSFSSIRPTPFAVSRRYPSEKGILYRSAPSSYYTGGPRDDTIPVLKVTDPDGSLRAVLFGYTCHPITLSGNMICGDYPGFAQQYIEEANPGATALFMQGACGQLVPNARYQVEYAMGHGRSLAAAVGKALEGEQLPVAGPIGYAYEETPLEFQPVPDVDSLTVASKSTNKTLSRKASMLLEKIRNDEPVETTLPFPFQVVRFGNDVLLIGLCGEPVVEYSVMFKSEYDSHRFVWVAGYCNDEFGYLPTVSILKEGGYEGGGAMLHTPYPGPFAESVEQRVVAVVRRLVTGASK